MRKREDLTGFGARLRKLREDRNITQKDMIAKVNEYFDYKRFATVQAYNRYEIYDAQPDIEMLKCFSHILLVSADELIGNDPFINESPLQQCLSIARKNGFEFKDNGQGSVELILDETDDHWEAAFSYDDFIDLINSVEETAKDEYISEFVGSFYQEFYLYATKNYDKVNYSPKNKNGDAEWVRFAEFKEMVQQMDAVINSQKDGDH